MGGWARQIAEVNVVMTDSNNNGIIDQWESKYGLVGTGTTIAGADPDADGLTNEQEFQQGLNPVVKNVVTQPTCTLPQVLQGGVCVTPVVPICNLPQVLQGGVCVTPVVPTCTLPQVLQGGVCVTPVVPTCTPPQVLQGGVCIDPPPFVATGSLLTSRTGHTATRLVDGRVLITGGDSSGNTAPYLRSAEIYDPNTGVFSFTGDMVVRRGSHTATLLNNGKVLIAGGFDQYSTDHTLSSTEIFDPATGQFELAGNMTVKRAWHTATLLNDGRVLITGGFDNKVPVFGTYLRLAEIYDPATGVFTSTGDMTIPRIWFSSTKLADGRVLIAGGSDGYGRWSRAAEIYDPATAMFASVGDMVTPRWIHNSALLSNGSVLFAGGNSNSGGEVRLKSAEIYDPLVGLFSSTSAMDMNVARAGASTTLLFDGRVLVAGGQDGSAVYKTSELFDPALKTFSFAPSEMAISRAGHTATQLLDGRVLLVGGTGANGQALSSTELYQPNLFETFSDTQLNNSVWNSNSGIGGITIANNEITFGPSATADTSGKRVFSGKKVTVVARLAGKGNGRDTNISLIDVDSGGRIQVGDTNYFGWGLYAMGTGAYNLLGANQSRGASTSGINLATNGVTTSAFKVIRMTIDGDTITVERGNSVDSLTEKMQRQLGASMTGRRFYLRIGTGAVEYSPGTFDWVSVSAY
jgi:hypothetical protein